MTFNAEAARKLVNEVTSIDGPYLRVGTNIALSKIEAAAKTGKRFVYLGGLRNVILDRLRARGFLVTVTYDQRDGDLTTVSW